jgi:hypothetical protein
MELATLRNVSAEDDAEVDKYPNFCMFGAVLYRM